MQRPRRTTRGNQTSKTPEQLAREDQLYSSLFGVAVFQDQQIDPEDIKREQLRVSRKQLLKSNIQYHPYVRAYHYYYPITQFIRLQGHPSYIIDNNIFGWNYNQETRIFGDMPLSKLINRVYVGLPAEKRQEDKKEMEDKLSQDIIQRQQRKYGLDRMIYTCNKILKYLQKLNIDGKVKQFHSVAKRQPELQLLSSNDISVGQKIDLLNKVIAQFTKKKQQLVSQQRMLSKPQDLQEIQEKISKAMKPQTQLVKKTEQQQEVDGLSAPNKKIKQE